MSALGHKRTYAVQKAMSALPPKSGHVQCTSHVCFVPIADIALLDHFVGPGKYCWRNCETECLRGLEINDKFVLIRCLHWQVGRPLSPEDAIYIDGGLPELATRSGPYEISPPSATGVRSK